MNENICVVGMRAGAFVRECLIADNYKTQTYIPSHSRRRSRHRRNTRANAPTMSRETTNATTTRALAFAFEINKLRS